MPTVPPLKDLEAVSKTSISNSAGLSYPRFRRTLFPRFSRVLFDILLGYLFLFLSVAVPLQLGARFPAWTLPLLLLCALGVGYSIAYLQLFLHEAAHFNIAPRRNWNDLLCNLFIASWAGQSTASYRAIHWDHHRFLGTTKDTERSYFEPLDLPFLFYSLTGIQALRVWLLRRRLLKIKRSWADRGMLLGGVLLNTGVMSLLAGIGAWPFAAAWAIGLLVFFPFFGALRQLLEHRSETARAGTDHSKTPHGKTTRMFKEGPLGSTFGAAGFSRHLLHHWDPQVSYTRLAEVEDFLGRTRLGPRLAASKTTYLRTFRGLFRP